MTTPLHVAGNLPKKDLIARQLPTNTNINFISILQVELVVHMNESAYPL